MRQYEAAPDAQTDAGAEANALGDARALQQIIEGTSDASHKFRRVEQKR
jgi:hypothetical protein